uniref:Uncharacterized protein n=1 Tax=Oryza meridionalis TaxID=40149 RepID=A0A0E0DIS9_9ORYZ
MQATANNIFHLSLTFFFFFMVLLSLGTSAAGVASDTLSNGRNLTDGNTLVGAARREESERLRPWPWPASPRRVASTRVLPREGADGIDRNGGRHGSRLRGEDGGLHGVTSRGAKLPVAGATVPRRREPLEAKATEPALRRRSATASPTARGGGDVAGDGAARRERAPVRTGRPDRGSRRWRFRELRKQTASRKEARQARGKRVGNWAYQ